MVCILQDYLHCNEIQIHMGGKWSSTSRVFQVFRLFIARSFEVRNKNLNKILKTSNEIFLHISMVIYYTSFANNIIL